MSHFVKSSTRLNLATLDPVTGSLTMPSSFAVAGLVRHLHLLKAAMLNNKDALLVNVHQIDLEIEYITNLLDFWQPVLADFEARHASDGTAVKNN